MPPSTGIDVLDQMTLSIHYYHQQNPWSYHDESQYDRRLKDIDFLPYDCNIEDDPTVLVVAAIPIIVVLLIKEQQV
jgi:hypothetical protein